MKRALLIMLLLVCSSGLFSQLGVINDSDGFTNVRSGPGNSYPIVNKINDNEPFWIVEESDSLSKWYKIIYCSPISLQENLTIQPYSREIKSGYIHKSRVLKIEGLQRLKKVVENSGVLFYSDSISLVVIGGEFEENNHNLTLTDKDLVDQIDNVSGYGYENSLPKRELKSITIKLGESEFSVPSTIFSPLYEPNLELMSVYLDNENRLFLSMRNGDGGIAYSALLIFQNGNYINGTAGSPY